MSERPLQDYLAYLLAQADRQMHLQLEEALAEEGVPVEQWRILQALSDGAGRAMGELADLVLMNHPALTKTIDRMVSRALVFRAPDAYDRRKVLIFISDRGRALHDRLGATVERHHATIDARFGGANTDELKRLLERFVQDTGRPDA